MIRIGSRICRPQINQRFEPLEDRRMMAGDTSELTSEEIEEKIGFYKDYFDEVMQTGHSKFLDLSIQAGTNGQHLYNLQFAVDGILSMYEATGDRATLDRAITYISNVMDAAEIIPGGIHEHDGFLDWEALAGSEPLARRQGFMLYDIQIGSAMSRLARIVHEDDRLQADLALQQFGDNLADFVDEQIIHKWLDARGNRGWLEDFHDNNGYWVGRATQFVNVCHNLSKTLGGASSCDGIQQVLAEQFRDHFVVQADGAYLWDTRSTLPSGNKHLAPDTGHENLTATMISRLAADDFVFNQTDVHHLGKTFTERIWNGRTNWDASPGIEDSPWFHNYIDGSDDPYRTYVFYTGQTEGMNGFVYDGWVRLGQFVPEVQLAGDALLSFIDAFSSSANAIRQRNGSLFGKVALPGHLARNLRFAEYTTGNSPASASLASLTNTDTFASAAFIEGDIDGDGAVGFSDFLVMSANFGRQDAATEHGDLDGDSHVGFADFLTLTKNFGRTAT